MSSFFMDMSPEAALQELIDCRESYPTISIKYVGLELVKKFQQAKKDAPKDLLAAALPEAARCSALGLICRLQKIEESNDVYDASSIGYIERCIRNQYLESGVNLSKSPLEGVLNQALVHAMGVSAERHLHDLETANFARPIRTANHIAETVHRYWQCRDGVRRPRSLKRLANKPLPHRIEARVRRALKRPVYVPSLKLALGGAA